LEKFRVQVKYEFNASNKDIYEVSALLAEGRVEKDEQSKLID
jgi:hypothetical protein